MAPNLAPAAHPRFAEHGQAHTGWNVPSAMLTVAAVANSTNAPTTSAMSDCRTTCGRANVRGPVASKPRASMARARRVPRRTAPTSRAKTVPAKSYRCRSGFLPASIPRARRAALIVCHSAPISGSSRSAASAAYANRAGTRAF